LTLTSFPSVSWKSAEVKTDKGIEHCVVDIVVESFPSQFDNSDVNVTPSLS
jgi:hypothetical protein